MNGWHEVRLGDLFQIKHGYAFKSGHFSDAPGAIILTPGNFEAGGGLKLRPGKDRSYDGQFPDEFRLSTDDLLVVMTDLTQEAAILGAPAYVPEGIACLHNQRLGKVVDVDAHRLDRRYLYYVFNTHDYRERLRATATGATVKHTSPSRIYDHVISLPPIDTQRRIASILGAYDDLIEVNRRRVAVLEEMARGLFEEWFVRFRFPGHESVPLVDTPDGPLPQGWSWGCFGDLVREIRDTVLPEAVEPGTPYVGLEHLARRSTTLADTGDAGSVGSLKARFQRGDILFGKIRPYFHKVAWAPFDGICSTDAIVWRPLPSCSAQALALASSDAFVAHSVQTSNGTKMPRANSSVLAAYRCALADSEISSLFERLVGSTVEQAACLQAANERLAASRDLLLPRLISGQLSVEAAGRELVLAA